MHSYRELTAPELVTYFASLGGRINKGRDAHMLSAFMKGRGATPTQLLLAMYDMSDIPYETYTKDIPTLLRSVMLAEIMEFEDLLTAEGYLVVRLTNGKRPLFLQKYEDLLDQDIPSAKNEAAFQEAKRELTEYCDNALSKSPSFGARSRSSRKSHEHGSSNTGTG